MTRSIRRASSGPQRFVLALLVVLSSFLSSACLGFFEKPRCTIVGVPNTNCTFTYMQEDGSTTTTTITFSGDGVAMIENCLSSTEECSPSAAAGG
jgi:hypothetical protein